MKSFGLKILEAFSRRFGGILKVLWRCSGLQSLEAPSGSAAFGGRRSPIFRMGQSSNFGRAIKMGDKLHVLASRTPNGCLVWLPMFVNCGSLMRFILVANGASYTGSLTLGLSHCISYTVSLTKSESLRVRVSHHAPHIVSLPVYLLHRHPGTPTGGLKAPNKSGGSR